MAERLRDLWMVPVSALNEEELSNNFTALRTEDVDHPVMAFHEAAMLLLGVYRCYWGNIRTGLPTAHHLEEMRRCVAAIPAEYHDMPLYRAALFDTL